LLLKSGVDPQAALAPNDSKSRAAARPQPRPAAGVKLAVGVIAGILALLAVAVWGRCERYHESGPTFARPSCRTEIGRPTALVSDLLAF